MESPVQACEPREPTRSPEEFIRIEAALRKLISKQAIETCTESEGQFVSTYFLVPKPDGSDRFIINLKNLNEFIQTSHFKMEDLRSAKNLLDKDAFMASIDIEDAYLLVPINKACRKLLRFRFRGQLYEFTCLPFGLSVSPYIFTKIMKPVVNKLRSRGFLSVVYLDDFLCIGDSFESCKANVECTIKFLESLGFKINYSKSQTTPSRRCKYLGFTLDSHEYRVEPTPKKRTQIMALLKGIEPNKNYKIRTIAHVIGTLVACCPGVEYGKVFYKRLERAKWLALLVNNNEFEGHMKLNSHVFEDIIWWKRNILEATNRIKTQIYRLVISSDASRTGWGAESGGRVTRGLWSQEDQKLHINHLELLAAFFALRCFASGVRNCEVLLRIDNTTAIAYINKAGGIKYSTLSELARDIWQWCENRNIWVVASYIPSKLNVEADRASREVNLDTEWELSQDAFQKIVNVYGSFSIDLFASRINKKCSRFCSRYPDPEAELVDAFTFSWSNENFYAFPPFALILPTLRKIINDKATGVVVAPLWPAQPGYPMFTSLLCQPPLILKPEIHLLQSPFRQQSHPLALKLSLVVGRLSGRLFSRREFQSMQLR